MLDHLGIGVSDYERKGVHVAFTAPDRDTVDAFHAAAMAAGAQDNGGSGVREIYHPNVCHAPA